MVESGGRREERAGRCGSVRERWWEALRRRWVCRRGSRARVRSRWVVCCAGLGKGVVDGIGGGGGKGKGVRGGVRTLEQARSSGISR